MSQVRAKGQLLPIIGVVLLVLFTLGTAAANLRAPKHPSKAELWAEERAEIVDTRRTRLVQLRAHVDHCEAANAHDLARLLVMDGRFDEVKFFAQGYQAQCGADSVVEHWGQAPRPRAR